MVGGDGVKLGIPDLHLFDYMQALLGTIFLTFYEYIGRPYLFPPFQRVRLCLVDVVSIIPIPPTSLLRVLLLTLRSSNRLFLHYQTHPS